MSYTLRQQLSFCIVKDRPIFLDLRADRYFCLDGAAETAFLALVQAQPLSATDRKALDRLMDRGFLREGSDGSRPFACIRPQPSSASFDTSAPVTSAWSTAGALLSLFRAHIALRRRSLSWIVDHIRQRKGRSQPARNASSVEAFEGVVEAFRRSGRIWTTHDKCLWRSIAMMDHLTRNGLQPTMVFGVALGPFAAHCWVEHGGDVLNDRLENVRNYTPILVV